MNIKISVRSLVEFIFRSGDISDSSSGTLSREAMNAGSRIHRKLQKRAGSHYIQRCRSGIQRSLADI